MTVQRGTAGRTLAIAAFLTAGSTIACGSDATAPQEPRFTIEIRYRTDVPASVQQAMNAAKARWEEAIIGKLPTVTVDSALAHQFCGVTERLTVDDLLVLVHVTPIDGPGGINAMQGECFIRSASDGASVPLVAMIWFDEANVPQLVANGQLVEVAMHELGHALGFSGFHFERRGCLREPTTFAGGTPDPGDTHFACPRAVWVFDSLGGADYAAGGKVPLENCALQWPLPCTSGRANHHWREAVLPNEIMSTYLVVGQPGVLSRLTLAALDDLGHHVNYRAATQWSVPAQPAADAAALYIGDDVVKDQRIGIVDSRGALVGTVEPGGLRD